MVVVGGMEFDSDERKGEGCRRGVTCMYRRILTS